MSVVIQNIKKKLSSQYFQNVGWLGIAELINRIFRLGTTITLARVFTEADYGLMAIVYTTFDIASVFTLKQGISSKIVQTELSSLEVVCRTSYWINWVVCLSIFLLQCLAAVPIALIMHNHALILPLCAVASIYLMFPVFLVQSALVTRENHLKVTALCNASQSLVNNAITIALALLGFGIWSVVAGMVLSTPLWILVNLKSHPWRPPKFMTFEDWQTIVSFGKNLLLVELLQKLRISLDYLIIAPILGLEQLGLYFFAFNAGSGITTNVVHTLIAPLFPKFCEVRESPKLLKKRYLSSLILISWVIGGIVFLQVTLSPFYVPMIFGSKWVPAIPILILICLSVLPRAYGWAAGALLNAQDKTHIDLMANLGFTIIFAIAILLAVHHGIWWVAMAVLLTHILFLIPFTVWVGRYSFPRP